MTMRRSALIALSLIIYFCFALAVVAKESNDSDSVKLKVSILEDTLKGVRSCQHTFSQVELLNLHATDPIMIHSIQTAPEETVLVSSTSGGKIGTTWDDEVIPQQLHVSRLPSGSLSIGAGQVAIVPLIFLPRYPNIDIGANDDYGQGENRPPPALSPFAREDLGQLVGESVMELLDNKNYNRLLNEPTKNRNNIDSLRRTNTGDEYEVVTTILVDTSRGVMKLPISASSFRENPYDVPDVIHFHHPEAGKSSHEELAMNFDSISMKKPMPKKPSNVVLLDSINFGESKRPGLQMVKTPELKKDCYDLYLSNHNQFSELEISEVLISRPELMSVEFDPLRLLMSPDLIMFPTEPSQVIRHWTELGPIYLPPDSVDNYIATLCTATGGGVEADEASLIYLEEMASWIDSGSPERSLGFLQVRTNEETLFIGLERFHDTAESQYPTGEKNHLSNTEETEPFGLATQSTQTNSLLMTTTDRFDFHLMSSASPAIVSKSGLQNKSPVPIRIMRMSIGLDTGGNETIYETAMSIGLNVIATLNIPGYPLILGATESIQDGLSVTCKLSSDSSSNPRLRGSLHFTGKIMLRGSMDTNVTFEEWRESIMQNPYQDSHLMLEVPFSVSILNGRVDITIERSTHPYPEVFGAQPWDRSGRAIAALFFPLSRLKVQSNSESSLPTQSYFGADEIGHDLRIMSNMGMALKLEGAEIVDSDNPGAVDSLCSRFNVSLTSPIKTSLPYEDFQELGFLALHYKFTDTHQKVGEKRKKISEREGLDRLHPTTCYLNVITSPVDTGVHRIPLIIFPGNLEVSTPIVRSDGRDEDEDGNDRKTTSMSFFQLLQWMRSSVVGKSLLQVLGAMNQDNTMRGLRSDSQLLLNYIRKLCRGCSEIETAKLKPILLKVGAIEHSEVSRTPFFLTNHNPVPMKVSVDVGEVEGMSITLGRDASQGRGDGDNILDYLPTSIMKTQGADKDSLVADGVYLGHPSDGLRQFLLSNERALSFSSRFPFRDAVSLNKAAVARQPILKSLYKFHSYVKFHREQLPEKANSLSSQCDSRVYPPAYKSFETLKAYSYDKQNQLPGPFMISGDKKLAMPLALCWENEMEEGETTDPSVIIPPGGTARFEVRVRSPPETFMNDDINEVLATGLVLSTNFGHVIPIFAAFEALQGQLHVSHAGTSSVRAIDSMHRVGTPMKEENITVISVPLGLFWRTMKINKTDQVSLSIPPARVKSISGIKPEVIRHEASSSDHGVSLYLSSTFSREVRLMDVESCNPWFKFVFRNPAEINETYTDLGINVGLLYSTISCATGSDSRLTYPSYYQCALNWLANRSDLQPPGCGTTPVLQKRKADDDGVIDASRRGIGRVRRAFHDALVYLKDAYSNDVTGLKENATSWEDSLLNSRHLIGIKSGRKRSNGLVPLPVLDVFAEAWDAWRVAADFGLGVVSSNLRAKIEYDSLSDKSRARKDTIGQQSLSLSMHNLAVESELSAPKLLDSKNDESSSGDDSTSIIEFPSTLVGTIASIMIPLRNPTPIPVRVRLGATSSSAAEKSASVDIDDRRKRYVQHLDPPYVQNGLSNADENENSAYRWWEGGGSFYMEDLRGDVISSNHNISIKAGAGALVSLVNPSLHSNVAFVVGCGDRCGIREKASSKNPELRSSIGAAAAAGITLVGRKRFSLPQMNSMQSDEPYVPAGGIPRQGGPPSFAIPYSALDEIVIPPYGLAEVGPIYFRPPGRFGTLGCDIMRESSALYWGKTAKDLCKEQNFESMIFLENSLTGLERVVLRGKSIFDHLYFLDPPPVDGEDAFGDIEFRDSRPTLLFKGTSVTNTDPQTGMENHTSVIKEVLLFNGGDVPLENTIIYLARDANTWKKRSASRRGGSTACSYGDFRLLDCWESDQSDFSVDGKRVPNVHSGFKLMPGESRSLFIEHVPNCATANAFASLNVEYATDFSSSVSEAQDSGILSISRSEDTRNHRAKRKDTKLKKKIELVLGYEMDEEAFSACIPADNGANAYARIRHTGILVKLVNFLVVLAAAMLLAYSWDTLSEFVKTISRPSKAGLGKNSPALSLSRNRVGTAQWNPIFRCLARADPTSTELQNLGREQVRQVIVSRYRGNGINPPQCLNHPGFFIRDRTSYMQNNVSRQKSGKEQVAGSDRARTLRDALFPNFSDDELREKDIVLPLGVGWRTAFSKGIIDDTSIRTFGIFSTLQSNKYLLEKSNSTVESVSSSDDQYDDNRFEDNEDSEEDELYDDEYGSEEEFGEDDLDQDQDDLEVHEMDEGSLDEEDLEQTEGDLIDEVKVEVTTDSTKQVQDYQQEVYQTKPKLDKAKLDSKAKAKGHKTPSLTFDLASTSSSSPESSIEKSKQKQEKKANGGNMEKFGGNEVVDKDTKKSFKAISSENKNVSKRNGRKVESSENSTKPISTQNDDIRNMQKQKGNVAQESSNKGKDRDKGRSQNQNNRAEQVSAKDASDARKDKTTKSKRGKGEANQARAESTLKKKGKNKSNKKDKSISGKTVSSQKIERFGAERKASKPSKADFRPPPGLAPPPGFPVEDAKKSPPVAIPSDFTAGTNPHDQSEFASRMTLSNPNLDLAGPSTSTALPFLQTHSARNDLMFPRNFGQPVPSSSTMTELRHSPEGINAGQSGFNESISAPMNPPLETQNDGFDVMDFLDSILNDGSAQEQDTGDSSNAGILLSNSAPVLSNPWASEGQSRAAAYGISFDAGENQSYERSPVANIRGAVLDEGSGNIPLLTPASILFSGQDEAGEDEEILQWITE